MMLQVVSVRRPGRGVTTQGGSGTENLTVIQMGIRTGRVRIININYHKYYDVLVIELARMGTPTGRVRLFTPNRLRGRAQMGTRGAPVGHPDWTCKNHYAFVTIRMDSDGPSNWTCIKRRFR
jgi:hypothetical protein